MLAVLEYATGTSLTTLSKVKLHLGITDSSSDDLLLDYIAQASDGIANYCNRKFAKQKYRETIAGDGFTDLMVSEYPVKNVSLISQNGSPITDYTLESAKAGMIYREQGWGWTAKDFGWATFQPLALSESADFTVEYYAGYSLPCDDVLSGSISVSSVDNSFNITGTEFPVLAPGDRIKSDGKFVAANLGTFTVVSATSAKIIVTETLTTEATDDDRRLIVRDLPHDLERQAIEAIKQLYLQRSSRSDVASKTVGSLSISYINQLQESGLPYTVERALKAGNYVRAA